MSKFTIYQVLPRLFGNYNENTKYNGSLSENGCGKFNSFTNKALREIKRLGITHIWYTGIIEHATTSDYSQYGIPADFPEIVKGNAGSPYAIKDYYDVAPDLAQDVANRMKEFEALVERTHKNDLQVIIDFVPNHVARCYHSDAKPKGVVDLGKTDNPQWHFSPLNNFYYIVNQPFNPKFELPNYVEFPARATGNDCFSVSPSLSDWYETVKLNYGINYVEGCVRQFSPTPDTWLKMRDILLFWAAKGVDGFRCDMAEMVPVEFWSWVIPQIKNAYQQIIFIAEIYQVAEYHNYIANGKFDYLYDKEGLYTTLRNVTSRNHAARDITYSWQSLGNIADRMLNFLENHDEQRIASGFFAGDGAYAEPAMIVAATLTKAPVMIYSGQETGETAMESEGFSGMDGRTSIFDYCRVKSIQEWANNGKFDGKKLSAEQKKLRDFYAKLLNITISSKAITDGLMYDLEYANLDNPKFNSHEQYAYFRKHEDELLLIILNFYDRELATEVRIPAEAFMYLQIAENQTFNCCDLLDQTPTLSQTILSSNTVFKTTIAPWKGKIFKLSIP
ncbi:MAG: alpha-amylase family protein [Paludibacter sp.]|jgi:glycosidase|nr:alpha-amylase family protein [Paludibacter sp.]